MEAHVYLRCLTQGLHVDWSKRTSDRVHEEEKGSLKGNNKNVCQKWDSNPRTDTCTRIPMHHLLAYLQTKVVLESGALDRSAILTTDYFGAVGLANFVKKSQKALFSLEKKQLVPGWARTTNLSVNSRTR